MSPLGYLNKFFIKYRYRLLLGTVFIFFSSLFAIYPAQVIRVAFDLINDQISFFQMFSDYSMQQDLYGLFGTTVLFFGVLVFLMALLRGIFLYFMRQTIIVVSRLIEYDLKNEIYAHYQVLSLSFYRRHNTGDLMARATEDVSRVRMYVGPAIMYVLNTVILTVVTLVIMLGINIKLTLFTVLPLPILVLIIYYVNAIINKKSELIQQQLSALSTFTQETFSGIRVIKAFGRERQFIEDFEYESNLYKEKSVDLARVQALFYPSILFLIGVSTTLTVYVGGIQVGLGLITAGTIAEFIYYIIQLTMPVTALGWVTSLIQRAAASQKRINEFLDTQPEITSGSRDPFTINGTITFDKVSFTYPDTGIEALKDVSFTILKGEMVAILGKTGSGKTTIANLLLRMYDATGGHIFIDGKDIKTFDLTSLRRQIGFVPQEVFLFSNTLSGNIAFGLDAASDAQIQTAAKQAAVYENIVAFPKGFDTFVGERGITLSGGQKQRVSIARALIKAPQVLIFDDSLSAVDTKTEEEILSNLGQVMKDKTAVIISHRVSTIKNADKILVLDEGQLVESGTHEELVTLGHAYNSMYEKQLLEEQGV